MCGLVGAVKLNGNLTDFDKKAFYLMLNFDTVRGEDSTGIIFDNAAGQVMYNKGLGTPQAIGYIGQKWLVENIEASNTMLCGHNRYATQGAINAENAHPFVFGNIVGAHNGTIKNITPLKLDKDFDVDSKYIFYHMSEKGFKSAMKAVNTSAGAACLTWVDNKEQSFNIIRNGQRPMFYCVHNNTLFYASEDWMIEVALMKAYNTVVYPKQLPVSTHLSVDLSKYVRTVVTADVTEEVKYVAPATNFRTTSSYTGGGLTYVQRKENVTVELVSDNNLGQMTVNVVWPLDLYGVVGKIYYATNSPALISYKRAEQIKASSKMWSVPISQVVQDKDGVVQSVTIVASDINSVFKEVDLTEEQETAIIEHEQRLELEDVIEYTEDTEWDLAGWGAKPVKYSAVKTFLGDACDCAYCTEPFPQPEAGLEGWDYDSGYGCMICPDCLESLVV